MARSTPRAVSQAATHERLVETARRLIVKESIPALSLRRLCTEAGFTQGAFYSNFADKDALILEIMERHLADIHRQLADLSASLLDADAEQTFEALTAWLNGLDDREEWAALAAELRLHAHRDRAFGDRLRAAEAHCLAGFAALLDDLARRLDLRPAVPTIHLAQIVLDLWYMTVLRHPEGDAPQSAFVAVLRQMLPPAMPSA
ncbi:TetR/AcrR family transcriptional regulator [Consotaella salsifontis]|uniref:Transcriptional regulator, TetR family n=1 Tax=Consotaella salsifontis TaxID=1365950 RepID=A0A1T4QGT3_9HYPH|nr:TetR/AcrR family transcriptional regulator [Consotaella salsifontis]SKA02498.1 transcriptional regulator, TetR family [Consotaella salsifontis]